MQQPKKPAAKKFTTTQATHKRDSLNKVGDQKINAAMQRTTTKGYDSVSKQLASEGRKNKAQASSFDKALKRTKK